jgi:hypothetical protein
MPNLEIEKAFKRIRVEVKPSGQTPWENSSLEGEFYFKPQQVTPSAQSTPQDKEPKKIIFTDFDVSRIVPITPTVKKNE